MVDVVGPSPENEMPNCSFGIAAAAFLSRPMMFPWMTEVEPPLKLLVTLIATLVFPEIRLRSAAFVPPIVALTVPPWGNAMSTPIALGDAERPVGSVPMKLPATTMPVGLAEMGLKSWMASLHRLTTSPRTVVSLAPIVMQRLGAEVPSISICSTVFSAPVALVFGALPGWV